MSTLQEIEAAIEKLPKEEFWQLSDWVLRRRDDEWDRQIDEAASAGQLDFLTAEADAARQAGTLRDWPGETK
jgi:hypothetical protein